VREAADSSSLTARTRAYFCLHVLRGWGCFWSVRGERINLLLYSGPVDGLDDNRCC